MSGKQIAELAVTYTLVDRYSVFETEDGLSAIGLFNKKEGIEFKARDQAELVEKVKADRRKIATGRMETSYRLVPQEEAV